MNPSALTSELNTLKTHLKKGIPSAGIDTLIDVLLTKMVTVAHVTKHIYRDPQENNDPYFYFIENGLRHSRYLLQILGTSNIFTENK